MLADTSIVIAASYYILTLRNTRLTRQAQLFNQVYQTFSTTELHKNYMELLNYEWEDYEDFEKVIQGPTFRGTPFDFFGFRYGAPYIIEFKGSLSQFNLPGETQKRRLQILLNRIEGLRVALLQVKLMKAQYRIFYDEDLYPLFFGPKAPIKPIEKWIRDRMKEF